MLALTRTKSKWPTPAPAPCVACAARARADALAALVSDDDRIARHIEAFRAASDDDARARAIIAIRDVSARISAEHARISAVMFDFLFPAADGLPGKSRVRGETWAT